MLKAISVLLALGLVAFAKAEETQKFDVERYKKLVKTAVDTGELMEGGNFDLLVLSKITPNDKSVPHQAEYFSAVGGYTGPGNFKVLDIAVESEKWTINADNNWYVEERGWIATPDGKMKQIKTAILVETMTGRVLDYRETPNGGVDDPKEAAIWNAKLEEWYALKNIKASLYFGECYTLYGCVGASIGFYDDMQCRNLGGHSIKQGGICFSL